MDKDKEVQGLLQNPVFSDAMDRTLKKILPDNVYNTYVRNEASLPASNEKRMAYALRVWKNNGWMDRNNDPIKYNSSEERATKRVTLQKLCAQLNSSAQAGKAKLDKMKQDGHDLQDFDMPWEAPMLMPRIVTQVVREAVEPALVLTSLLPRLQFTGLGETITFPAVGAMAAEDMAPGQEYPEKTLDWDSSTVATLGKVGIAVRFTDDMMRYSNFDLMSIYLQAAGRAMARKKEQKVWNHISTLGSVAYDNSGGSSVYGYTTGRDAVGTANGGMTLQDLFQVYAGLLNAGFMPNTLLMNPMGWLVFAQNETIRSMGFLHNGPLWGPINGMPGQAPTFGPMHQGGGNALSTTPSEMTNATLQSTVPGAFPAPLRIVVSPFVGYNSSNPSTDIVMCDSSELGMLVEDEPLMTESWEDPARDMMKTKMRERYAVVINNGGQSVAQIKGVRLARTYDWDNFVVEQSYPSTGLPEITGF